MMERTTMEQAVSRQQIAMIREWDAYQASLRNQERRQALAPAKLTMKVARHDGKKRK
jgi:hypothetical protein